MKKIYLLVLIFLISQVPNVTFAEAIDNETDLHISFEIDLMHWNDADLLLPKYSKFTVIDVETGKSFEVQRRAGRSHTDVQPLTSKDTKIMKAIYNGKWSWKRRAILVQTGDYLIPASMHGMPHGAGAIQNNFPGHFCIHFQGSTTHKTDEMDFSHKLMILKAAGILDDYVLNVNAKELIHIFVEGINQHDYSIISLTTTTKHWNQNKSLSDLVGDIETIKIKEIEFLQENERPLLANVIVDISMYTKSKGKQKGQLHVALSRSSLIDSWKIHDQDVRITIE